MPEADLPAVLDRAAELADAEDVYLQVSMIVLLSDRRGNGDVNENHAVLLGPDGGVEWDYLKSRPTPGDGHRAGPGTVPVVVTPYGRLATVICQDDFFPSLLRQAGRADVDILLLPFERLGSDHRLACAAGTVSCGRERDGARAADPAGHLAGHGRPGTIDRPEG